MKILLDMNLSPDWAGVLNQNGLDAVHWSAVGNPSASDQTIMQWASANGCVVITHDLDFGAILAATGRQGLQASSNSARKISYPTRCKIER